MLEKSPAGKRVLDYPSAFSHPWILGANLREFTKLSFSSQLIVSLPVKASLEMIIPAPPNKNQTRRGTAKVLNPPAVSGKEPQLLLEPDEGGRGGLAWAAAALQGVPALCGCGGPREPPGWAARGSMCWVSINSSFRGRGGADECAINEPSSIGNNSRFVSPAPPQLLSVRISLPRPQNTHLCLLRQLVMD